MPRTPRWKEHDIQDGVMHVEMSSWKYFHDFIRQEMLDFAHYIWRGQKQSSWGLDTSLDRLFHKIESSSLQDSAEEHLARFKLAARGRRGSNPASLSTENDWWAIAQHYGMATPLLDWTQSPFVALYFAFQDESIPRGERRAVWALGGFESKLAESAGHYDSDVSVYDFAGQTILGGGLETTDPTLETIHPMQDENARLVNQASLFTRVSYGYTVESVVSQVYKGEQSYAPLIKISFPNRGRDDCMRTLNNMNINHLSLFPDLFGAGEHCNKALQIRNYL